MVRKKPDMLAQGVRRFDDWFAIENIAPGVHAIGEPRFHQINWNYLIEGQHTALLFDTGPGVRDISEVVRTLTKLPLIALPSHLHFDHTGNLHRFQNIALADLPVLRASAYLRLPSTMLTRQELSIVPCEKPILSLSSACAAAVHAVASAAAAKISFLLMCRVISTSQECPARRYCRAVAQLSAQCRGISLSPSHFEENRSDDDGTFHNLLRERRNTEEIEYVGKNRDDRSPQYGSTHPAFTTKQACAPNDGNGDGLEFQPHASDRLTNRQA
jgi:hypothetical protein